MNKALLIGILVALLLGIAGLVWWQGASYDQREQDLKRQLEKEYQIRDKTRPYTAPRTSDNAPVRPQAGRFMGAYL